MLVYVIVDDDVSMGSDHVEIPWINELMLTDCSATNADRTIFNEMDMLHGMMRPSHLFYSSSYSKAEIYSSLDRNQTSIKRYSLVITSFSRRLYTTLNGKRSIVDSNQSMMSVFSLTCN
jgi:hypothetical protein